MSHLYLNEERDYPEENTCENKNLSLQHSPRKETKHIHATAPCLLHTILEEEISIGANARSSDWRCSVKKGVF